MSNNGDIRGEARWRSAMESIMARMDADGLNALSVEERGLVGHYITHKKMDRLIAKNKIKATAVSAAVLIGAAMAEFVRRMVGQNS